MTARTGESDFDEREREAFYRLIRARRDVRSHFLDTPLGDDLIARILGAAHCAPSVGLMQPWRFILIRSLATRRRIRDSFIAANAEAQNAYEGERAQRYAGLKLEGILSAPVNICVVADPTLVRGHGLGRRTMPETAIYSAVCAVQNLWLAARAEGVGVGWVSILDPEVVRSALAIPPHVAIVAYLCIGYVAAFEEGPELERAGWERRVALEEIVDRERYAGPS